MTFLGTSSLVNFITCLSLGIFVYSRNPAEEKNRVYFLLNLTVAFYSLSYFYWQLSQDYTHAAYWFRLVVLGIILINYMYLHFVFSLLELVGKMKRILMFFAFLSLFFSWLNFKGNLYTQLRPLMGLGYWPKPTLYFDYFLLYWHFSCFFGFYFLLKELRITEGIKKQQIRFVMIACAIGFIGGATNWFMWYGINFPPYPNFLISFYVGLIAYTMVRYRLMDLNLLMRWGIAYGVSLSIIAIIFAVTIFSLEDISGQYLLLGKGIPTLILACISVLIFDPLRKKIAKIIDRFIFKSPDFQLILIGIEKVLSKKTGFETIAEGLSKRLKEIWKVDHAAIAIWNPSSAKFDLFPEDVFQNKPITKLNESIGVTDFLVRTLESERRLFPYGIIIEDEVTALGNRSSSGEKSTFWKIRRTMRWLGASACVPIMAGSNLSGFIILGSKQNNGIYNTEDKKFLSHVSGLIVDIVRSRVYSY